MTWKVRLAEPRDYEAISEMARQNMEESCPEKSWSEERMRCTFFEDYHANSQCIIFVAENKGAVSGFVLTGVYQYRAFDGLFTVQEVLYVKPENRGSRAAALLMKKLIEWSKNLGALEVLGGNDNDIYSDQTARFLSRFGFKSLGNAMKLDLRHGK